MKRWLSILLGLIISGLTLAYALNGNDISKIGGELAGGNYLWAVPCLALIAVGLWLRAIRWRFLLQDRPTIAHSFHITNIAYFFNVVLPFRLGEVARAYLTTRLKPPISMFTAFSSVVVERLIDTLTVVVLVALAIVIRPVTPEVERGAQLVGAASTAALLILIFFAVRPKFAHQIVDLVLKILPFLEKLGIRTLTERVLDGILPLGSLRGIAVTLLWTTLAWATSVAAGFFLLYVFYDAPTWDAALLMIAITSLAVALPAAPGSVGPFEAGVIAGLQVGGMIDPAAGLPNERAFAYAVLLHIANVAVYAVLGYIGLMQERVSLREVFAAARQTAANLRGKPISEEKSA